MKPNNFLLFFLIFFSVFKVQIGIFDFTIFSIALATFLVLIKSVRIEVNKHILLIFSSIYLIQLITLFLTLFSESSNLFFALKYSRLMLSFVATYIIYLFISHRYEYKKVVMQLGYVLVFHMILMWLQVFFPSFKEIVQDLFFSAGRDNWYRVTGLMNGTSSAGIFLGLSSIVILYLYLKYKEKKFLVFFIACLPLYPLSAITGLIISLIGSGLLLYVFKAIKLGNIIKVGLAMALLIYVFIASFYADIEFLDDNGITSAQSRIMLLFDDEVSIQHGNVIESTNTLTSTYELPENNHQFLFGNIQPSKSEFATTNSDAGIITNFHAYGLIGSVLLLFTLLLHALIAKNSLISILTLCYLVAYTKNDLLFGRIIYDLYLSLVLITIMYKGRK